MDAPATLAGKVTDDGVPVGSALTIWWSLVSSPGQITFTAPHDPATQESFSAVGTYVLRLSATDLLATNSAKVVIVVEGGNP